MAPVQEEELLRECVMSCHAMRRAFDNLVRRNVLGVCERRGITDPEVVEKMVRLTLMVIHRSNGA